MVRLSLRVIPEPAPGTRVVFATHRMDDKFQFVTSEEDTDLLCGQCRRELCSRLTGSAQLDNIVLKCPKCGAFNDTANPLS